jgi:hypothetical protein
MRLILSTVLTVLLITSCGKEPSVKQQVIATLRNMEYAAEEGQHLDFMTYIADSFSGQQGSLDRREFHRFMIFQINQHRRLQAQFFPIFVNETGTDMASAQFKLLVTGGAGLLPESGQLFEVETAWIYSGGDWLLSSAQWQPVQLPDP